MWITWWECVLRDRVAGDLFLGLRRLGVMEFSDGRLVGRCSLDEGLEEMEVLRGWYFVELWDAA